jgi:hypothetical protein
MDTATLQAFRYTHETLLSGKKSEYPRGADSLTHKQAQRRRKKAKTQTSLLPCWMSSLIDEERMRREPGHPASFIVRMQDPLYTEGMSDFTFRLRFIRSPRETLDSDAETIEIPLPSNPKLVVLSTVDTEKAIRDQDAVNLAVKCSGFESESDAREAGDRCQNALQLTFTRLHIGADFGDRGPTSVLTKHGLNRLEREKGQKVAQDVHGLMIYESDPSFLLARVKVSVLQRVPVDKFRAVFAKAAECTEKLSAREHVSLGLFSASFFQKSLDSRFLLLIMAIEVLLDLKERPSESVEHVKNLIKATEDALEITNTEGKSLLGCLRWLRYESIRQAGKRVVKLRLKNKEYHHKSGEAFFSDCYDLRSRLVHGEPPLPAWDEINSVTGDLESMVSDLLTVPYLGEDEGPVGWNVSCLMEAP